MIHCEAELTCPRMIVNLLTLSSPDIINNVDVKQGQDV